MGMFERIFGKREQPAGLKNAQIFRMMEERLGLNPSDIWMIGDSYKHDIEGAMNAGWHTVWIDRRGRTDIEGHPDHTVYSDEELIKVMTDVWL